MSGHRFWISAAPCARLRPVRPTQMRGGRGSMFAGRSRASSTSSGRICCSVFRLHKTRFNRFVRWSQAGMFARMFDALAGERDATRTAMIDAPPLPATSLLTKGHSRAGSAAHGAGSLPSGLRSVVPMALPDPAPHRWSDPRLSRCRCPCARPVGCPASARSPKAMTATTSAPSSPGAASPPTSPGASTAGTRSNTTPPSPSGAPASRAGAADSRRGAASPGETVAAPTPFRTLCPRRYRHLLGMNPEPSGRRASGRLPRKNNQAEARRRRPLNRPSALRIASSCSSMCRGLLPTQALGRIRQDSQQLFLIVSLV